MQFCRWLHGGHHDQAAITSPVGSLQLVGFLEKCEPVFCHTGGDIFVKDGLNLDFIDEQPAEVSENARISGNWV